jgi:5-(carboxyamino)imidazole ribonucleotide synthase
MQKIGIIGGGQLGRMLCQEAQKLGFEVTILDPNPKSSACQVANSVIIAEYDDRGAVNELFENCDFVTFELEAVDSDLLQTIHAKFPNKLNPLPNTLSTIQDKFVQKEFLKSQGLPISNFENITTTADTENFGEKYGHPFILKTKQGGFDGRGNFVVKNLVQAEAGFVALGANNLYAEQFVEFTMEISVVLARDTKGNIKTYPVTQTIQKNNICYKTITPAPISEDLTNEALKLAKQVINEFRGAGVFAIEMFVTKDNRILINEIAPRVHNSGHWTQNGSVTSQFEQHIRAISGLPLGETDMISKCAVMINILGESDTQIEEELYQIPKTLAIPDAHLHIYNKGVIKKDRKMGHINILDESLGDVEVKLQLLK